MFRLFLIDRINPDPRDVEGEEHYSSNLPENRLRNRRIFERFQLDSNHLALMNDQDIFVVRDISGNGFSTEVSPNTAARINIGDIYNCRLRYFKENFHLTVKVAWTDRHLIGFSMINPQPEVKSFIERLITPLEIGFSMEEVEAKLVDQDDRNLKKRWFHSPSGTELFTWQQGETLKAWRLEDQEKFINWSQQSGMTTGIVKPRILNEGINSPWTNHYQIEDMLDPNLQQFAMDVFMALQLTEKDHLLATLME